MVEPDSQLGKPSTRASVLWDSLEIMTSFLPHWTGLAWVQVIQLNGLTERGRIVEGVCTRRPSSKFTNARIDMGFYRRSQLTVPCTCFLRRGCRRHAGIILLRLFFLETWAVRHVSLRINLRLFNTILFVLGLDSYSTVDHHPPLQTPFSSLSMD
jgi:hypothetical protein